VSYSYEYPRPTVAVDLVIRHEDTLLLIRRGNDPFAGRWALPGGFVEPDETVEQAAVRELAEETSVSVDESAMRLVGVYSAPGRDPRGWAVSVAFAVDLADRTEAEAGDDAAEAEWVRFDALPGPLAFDHDQIIAEAQAAR
jgi:8-oxo-dGTP diphosphatase